MVRRTVQLAVAVCVSAALVLVAGMPARADVAGTLLTEVNALRATHGMAPLATDTNLTTVAQAWSAHMAATGVLAHNPDLATQIGAGSTNLGENVGFGTTLAIIFTDLVNSPGHLANMLTNYNLTGIGVASDGKYLWVTEDFETKTGASAGTAAPRTPAPTAAVATTRPVPMTKPVVTLPPTTPPPTTAATTTTSTTTPTPTTVAAPTGSAPSGGGAGKGGEPAPVPLAPAPVSAQIPAGGVGTALLVGLSVLGLVLIGGTALLVNRWARSS